MEQTQQQAKRERGSGRTFRNGTSRFWWIAYHLHGIEYRESAKTEKLEEAQRYLKRKIKEVGAAQIGAKPFLAPAARRVTISELLNNLETDKKLRGKTGVGTLIKKLNAEFGPMRAAELTAARVSQYIERLLVDEYKNAAINRRLQILGQAFRLAVKDKLLSEMPRIARLPEHNARKGFTTRSTLNRVLANLPEDIADVVLFAFLSSWRRGEILSLTWDNWSPDTIRLAADHSKEREARSLALEGELAEVIARRQAKANGPLIFHRAGRAIVDFKKSWKTACRLAGVPGLLLHDLRRSAVRDMIRAGVAPHVAMSVSGHKTDSMLRRYAIISEADQREALRRTEEFRKAEAENAQLGSTAVQ